MNLRNFIERPILSSVISICIVVVGVYLVKHQYSEQSAETM